MPRSPYRQNSSRRRSSSALTAESRATSSSYSPPLTPSTSFTPSAALTPETSLSSARGASPSYNLKNTHPTPRGPSAVPNTPNTSPLTSPTTHESPFIPTTCLQCSLLALPCSTTHPTCSRCARRHLQPYNGWYGLLEDIEPCLAQRKRTVEEFNTGRFAGAVELLCRLEDDGDGTWERKLELASELLEEVRKKRERANWALPMATGVVGGASGAGERVFGVPIRY